LRERGKEIEGEKEREGQRERGLRNYEWKMWVRVYGRGEG
jgi:hypothetical protein